MCGVLRGKGRKVFCSNISTKYYGNKTRRAFCTCEGEGILIPEDRSNSCCYCWVITKNFFQFCCCRFTNYALISPLQAMIGSNNEVEPVSSELGPWEVLVWRYGCPSSGSHGMHAVQLFSHPIVCSLVVGGVRLSCILLQTLYLCRLIQLPCHLLRPNWWPYHWCLELQRLSQGLICLCLWGSCFLKKLILRLQSTIIQLRTVHAYTKSYLNRIPTTEIGPECKCRYEKQKPEHLLLWYHLEPIRTQRLQVRTSITTTTPSFWQ